MCSNVQKSEPDISSLETLYAAQSILLVVIQKYYALKPDISGFHIECSNLIG